MQIDHIKPHFEIRVMDSDPETGIVFRDQPVAMTTSQDHALAIQYAMNQVELDSHRSYYILSRNKILV
jgi:hypothetical protein